MKTINRYITEKLKISKSTLIKHTLFPKTKEELQDMIKKEVKEIGYHCSLNHIDVSKITDMSSLFDDSELYYFKGDISSWDVSNVTDMKLMFFDCDFNGDLSDWDVSNVTNMWHLFDGCKKLDCDLSRWNVTKAKATLNMFDMFDGCDKMTIPNWYKKLYIVENKI